MTATPANVDQNRADAHYPADVTTKKPRRRAELTPEQQESVERVRAVCQEVQDAEQALAAALVRRADVIREEWVRELRELRPTRVAREVGENLIKEGTVRGITHDLRARERAHQQ